MFNLRLVKPFFPRKDKPLNFSQLQTVYQEKTVNLKKIIVASNYFFSQVFILADYCGLFLSACQARTSREEDGYGEQFLESVWSIYRTNKAVYIHSPMVAWKQSTDGWYSQRRSLSKLHLKIVLSVLTSLRTSVSSLIMSHNQSL